MAEAAAVAEQGSKRSVKPALLLGLAAASVLGGAGFYAVNAGLILPAPGADAESASAYKDKPSDTGGGPAPAADAAFVAIEPLILNFGRGTATRHLRFRASLEVAPEYAHEVEAVLPRVVDVLITYLRALELADLERPDALTRLRSQLLRRVKMVTGDGRVRDLLVMEFVLN